MSKTILITGASNGFGKDTAKTLAAAGYRVFGTMRDLNGRNSEAAAELRAAGVTTLELDVTNDASVDAAFAEILDNDGKIDVLINNAGLASAGIAETFTPDQLRDLFEVNVIGVQRVLRAALPTLRTAGSSLVINVGSIVGRLTIPFFGLYGASKFAVEALTDTYRFELSQLGVDVVLVQPGPFPTALYSTMQAPGDAARADAYGDVAKLPGNISARLGEWFSAPDAHQPHEVAEAIARLIATPAGQRPDRVVVGSANGADVVNAAVQAPQAGVLAAFGFDHLAHVKVN